MPMAMTRTNQITREEVFRRYPWLDSYEEDMITHNDLDGILTAMLFKHARRWKLVGVYDLKTLSVTRSYKDDLTKPIYVDLDVTHKDFRSIGHHILGQDEGDHLNINRLFGIGHNTYTKKFPLSTAVFLMWLYEIDFKELPDLAKLFLVHSDSMWKNYHGYEGRYRQNVTEWLARMGLDDVKAFLDSKDFHPALEKFVLPNTYSYNKQCTYLMKNGSLYFRDSNYNVQKYVSALCSMFKFEDLQMPTDLETRFVLKRQEFPIVNRNLQKTIDDVRAQYNVFSYSVKFVDKIDISYF